MERIDASVAAGLEIHLVLDNYGTHKHPEVNKWLSERPHYHVHFTPTSSSWLNQIERWFAEITRKRIRRGYVPQHPRFDQGNVASASKIIRKVNKCKETLETGD